MMLLDSFIQSFFCLLPIQFKRNQHLRETFSHLDIRAQNLGLAENTGLCHFMFFHNHPCSTIRALTGNRLTVRKLLPYYKDWYNSCPDCEYLLHTEDGKRFLYRNYYDSYWTPLVEQIGIDRTPHCTRHTCISMLSEAGVQDTTIKKIVGHSGAMTLTEKVYTHLDMQVLVDAINKTLEDEDSVTADTKSA